MKRASSRKKAVKVPAAAAVADATSDEEQQVSAESIIEATLKAKTLSKSNPKSSNPPIIRIVTSNQGRSTAIDTIIKTRIKGPDMFNLVEQYLVQQIGEETPMRAVPVEVRTALNIMCSTKMADEDSGEDFIRLSTVLGGDEGRMFNTLLDSVRLHCYSSPFHFTRLLHQWSPQSGQQSVLQLMTSYLNIMEKAMGVPFNLANTTEQFKEFFHKVPQTAQQSFSLATGLPKAVETKVDFAGFRAAVSTYMQNFLAHNPSQPVQSVGSLYSVQQQRRKEPIFRILPSSRLASNTPLAQPRIKIVNSPQQQPEDSLPSRSTNSDESYPYDCRFFHTAKGCRYGTRENPELCKWVHSSGKGRELNFGNAPMATESAEPPAKRWRTVPNRRTMVSFVERPETAAPQQEVQADVNSKGICFQYRDTGRCRKSGYCRYEHADRSQQ